MSTLLLLGQQARFSVVCMLRYCVHARVHGQLMALPGLTARRDEAARWILEG